MSIQDRPTVHFEPLDPDLANRYHEVSAQARSLCPVVWSTGHWAAEATGFWLVTGYPRSTASGWTTGASPPSMGRRRCSTTWT